MAQRRTERGGRREPWLAVLPEQVRRAVRAVVHPLEVRCPECDAPMTVLSETPTTTTATLICWRREAECGRCGHRVVKQLVQHLPDSL